MIYIIPVKNCFQFVMERGFSKKSSSDSQVNEESECIDTENNIDLLIAKVGHSESNCQSENEQEDTLDIEEIETAKYKTIGAPPARSLEGMTRLLGLFLTHKIF